MKKSRKTGKYLNLFLLPLLGILLLFPAQVRADGYSCTAEIPVEVQLEGDADAIPTGADYQINIKAVTADAPMPAETAVSITDSGYASFGMMTYTAPGDYVYTVTQTERNQEYCTYDKTIYTVTVRVVNGSSGLAAEIWAVKDGGTDKTENIVFTNVYEMETGTDQGETEKKTDQEDTPLSSSSGTSVTRTGDGSAPILWGAIAVVAAVVAIIAMRRRKREKRFKQSGRFY